MAEHTIELKDVVKGHNIFDFRYPFYDEEKRAEFEADFIQHFFTREIGTDTVDRFKLYLRDKFATVFPYYNELFKTALIEYNLTNNYDLTETHTLTRENNGKSSGITSTVGRSFDESNSTTDANRTANKTETTNSIGRDAQSENTIHSDSEGTNTNGKNVKKFLDTPQGRVDLTDSKYLTNLTQDDSEGATNTTRNGSSDHINTIDKTLNNVASGDETVKDKTDVTASSESKTTADGNTRTYSEGKEKEIFELKRFGNIGIQTASDMLEKHIALQKKLKTIELNFFNECNDLFMIVY